MAKVSILDIDIRLLPDNLIPMSSIQSSIYWELQYLKKAGRNIEFLVDELMRDPDSYPFTIDDLELFAETYKLI